MIPFNANQEVCNQRSGVYAIVNLKTEKFYIGSAVKLNRRKNHHLRDLRKNKHDNRHLQRSYNKHGEEVFIFKVLEYVEDENNLLKVEQKYLDIYFPTGITYNICGIAGSPLGIKRSEETRKKMSAGRTGIIFSDETKKKMGEAKLLEQKPIIQLTKNNDFVKKYNSIREASRETEIYYGSISKCCRGKLKTAGGYLWLYETDYEKGKRPDKNNLIHGCSKPVLQFTKNNGFVKKYNSAVEAAKELGIDYSSIRQCCNGKYKSSGGYIWQLEQLYNQN